MSATLLRAVAVLVSCAPAAHPIVAEVYYDAPGDDTGHEFVELYNPGPLAWPLEGVRIESGDGAGPGRWTVRWTGAAGESIRAGARFVVGGALVDPAPDAIVTLDLQNGPDAMRLAWPDGATEVVGWGALALPEYSCGEPAPDVPAGSSLARVPDDADLGSNALDFRPAAPSPGRANQPTSDLALVPGSLALAPTLAQPGEAVRLRVRVANRGRTPLAPGAAAIVFSGDALADSLAVPLPACAAGESLAIAAAGTAAEAGPRRLSARLSPGGDDDPSDDALALGVRVGPGPLEITEIQFHPAGGEGEWIEVRNRSGAALALAGFTLADRTGTRARFPAAGALAAESLAVLCQDRPALLAARPGLDSARVAAGSPWPSLNNSNDESGTADEVSLADSNGLAVDAVAYSASGVPAGVTLEKRDGAWLPSALAGGTPLSPPWDPGPAAGEFALAPRRLGAGARDVRFSWRLPWPGATVSVELYDLDGHRVSLVLAGVPSGRSGEAHAALADLAPGVYVAVLRARAGGADVTRAAPLRIAGPAR